MTKITFCLNWEAAPYHIPLYLAQTKGYFTDEDLDIAILEPSNPSDVTNIIGSGQINMGFKAMVHTLAASARGFPVTSIGSLLDEPFTGVLYLKGSGITSDFRSLKGKKIGYVGEFGKIQIDELTKHFGMTPDDYTAVRCGMNVAKYIIDGSIDAGIGIECIQQVELEHYCRQTGRPDSDVQMLRIDQLAELGCCCFCTILYIVNDDFLAGHQDEVRRFMKAVKRATDYVLANPEAAWREYINFKPQLDNKISLDMFSRCYAYLSESLYNVERDWNKVTRYGERLEILPLDYKPNYSNEYLSWKKPEDTDDPQEFQEKMVGHQEVCRAKGGYRRLMV